MGSITNRNYTSGYKANSHVCQAPEDRNIISNFMYRSNIALAIMGRPGWCRPLLYVCIILAQFHPYHYTRDFVDTFLRTDFVGTFLQSENLG